MQTQENQTYMYTYSLKYINFEQVSLNDSKTSRVFYKGRAFMTEYVKCVNATSIPNDFGSRGH